MMEDEGVGGPGQFIIGPGQFIITRFCRHPEFGDALRIDRADPEIWIADEILRDLHFKRGRQMEEITLTRPTEGHGSSGDHNYPDCAAMPGMVCFVNNLLKIEAINRTVVYRIVRYLPGPGYRDGRWVGVWPD